ncbi:Methyltransf-11 domain-containing protein [Aphelenchoides besseyi]|nr:Methyltransf-11 domain-containing protein [Aphelenchoides besseyi]
MPPLKTRQIDRNVKGDPTSSLLGSTSQFVSKNKTLTSTEKLKLYGRAMVGTLVTHDWVGYVFSVSIAIAVEIGIIWYMMKNVKYTNIDWTAYMEQVEIYKNGERNYFKIRGDTGPLVYPAGHLHIYSLLHQITDEGRDVRKAQWIFVGVYVSTQLLVFALFARSRKIGSGVLIVMTLLSFRIHSIYMLRLFNDPIAMLLFFISTNFLVSKQFAIACLFYSLAVSVKMNIILFAPALFFVLLLSNGPLRTIAHLAICALVQLAVGFEFLVYDPLAYIGRAFELGRVFQFRWSVNWQFVNESLFLSTNFHLILLLAHVTLLCIFMFTTWFRRHGNLIQLTYDAVKHNRHIDLDVHDVLFALFTANLAGIVFARSIHFQFYTWYYHSLFYLLYASIAFDFKVPQFKNFEIRIIGWLFIALMLFGIELVYNVYPPRPLTSVLLFAEHFGIVSWLLYTSVRKEEKDQKSEMLSGNMKSRLTRIATSLRNYANASTSTIPGNIKVFDREMKRRQRNWAAKSSDFQAAQTLREECGYRIADRVFDLTKFNDVCVDLGCGAGFIAPHLVKENVGVLIQCDISDQMVKQSRGAPNDEFPTLRIVADEENVPFHKNSVDLVLSSLAAHWINDLPGWFRRCFEILRPDGAMIGSLLAGETIHEVRVSLQLAEMERLGGLAAHVSPFVKPQDIGSLMNRGGFDMVTLDLEEIEIGYPNLFALLYDLQSMAESNASYRRSPLRRDTLIAAQAIYQEMYGKSDGHLPCTFQVLSFIGWKPGPNMPKPAKRGSQSHSLSEIGKFVQSPEEFAPANSKTKEIFFHHNNSHDYTKSAKSF